MGDCSEDVPGAELGEPVRRLVLSLADKFLASALGEHPTIAITALNYAERVVAQAIGDCAGGEKMHEIAQLSIRAAHGMDMERSLMIDSDCRISPLPDGGPSQVVFVMPSAEA